MHTWKKYCEWYQWLMLNPQAVKSKVDWFGRRMTCDKILAGNQSIVWVAQCKLTLCITSTYWGWSSVKKHVSCHLSIVIVSSFGSPQSNLKRCYLFSVGWATSFTGQIKFPSQRHRHCLEINAGCHYILKHIYKFLNIYLKLASLIQFTSLILLGALFRHSNC